MEIKEIIYRNFFRIMPKAGIRYSTVGLDIGNSSVKLVKTERDNNAYRISALGVEEVKSGNVKDAVKAVLAKAGVENKRVNIGLCGKQTVIRCVVVPEMEETDFKNSLKYEAAKYIPFPLSEVIWDSKILKHNIESSKMLVLIAAAKKDFVTQKLKMILDLGLEPCVLDIDSLALVNAFDLLSNKVKPDKKASAGISVLLNIGSHLSSLVFLEDNLVRFGRDIAFGGNSITQKIAAKLNINFGEAEKNKLSLEKTGEIKGIIESSLTDLANELRLSFDYYESQTGKTAQTVYLSGGGSSLDGICVFMGSAMNILFEAWNPLAALKQDDGLDKKLSEGFSSRFAVAAGLSLR
ncbi:MAG: type IV pilus assembly protein PilM [Candidatus Omnitrophota bacterium]|nr:type IV pilus assembly protein PilM [Candidatus Omnitrophota bacterium]